VLRKLLGPKREEARKAEKTCIVWSFVVYIPHKNIWVNKSRRPRLVGHVSCVTEERFIQDVSGET
jgi:hypothetical protein